MFKIGGIEHAHGEVRSRRSVLAITCSSKCMSIDQESNLSTDSITICPTCAMETANARESPKRHLDRLEEISVSKRRRYHHNHNIHTKAQSVPSHEPALVEPWAVDKLLVDAIKTVCEEEGIKQDVQDPAIESVALESYRNAVEEFILKLCTMVRRSMHAARRTTPIATDFEAAMKALDIPLERGQLLSYRTRPVTNPPLLPTPPPEDPFHDNVELPPSFLGPELNGTTALKRFALNTASLPPLPSAHTYKDTEVFPHRETDSRRLRELATEEGKLGEQALRKLAGAVKVDAAHPVDAETKKQAAVPVQLGRTRKKPEVTEEAVFEEAMRDLLKAESEGFELGPMVTSEKQFRMPDDAQVKRKAVVTDGTPTAAAKTAAEPSNPGVSAMEGVETDEL